MSSRTAPGRPASATASTRARWRWTLSPTRNSLGSPGGHQGRREPHRSVGALTVLEQGDQRAADGDGGPVQRVDVDRARLGLRAVAAVEPPGLVVGRVRARRQLPVAALARDPALAVELPGRGGAEVADRDVDDPVGDLEVHEERLLDGEDALVLVG